tara:strand:+ start:82 stop:999 length:918 start_codon:yes stop_codon:yes gene_type:complete
MEIHENQNNSNRSKSTCGYCRTEGHNQYQCPHVKGDWENFLSKWKIPVDDDGQPIRRGYNYMAYYYGSNNGVFDPLTANLTSNGFVSWFNNCRKAYLVQKERGFNLEHKVKRGATNRSCGFCGSTDHTRRNCSTMKQFLKDCYKANENWRRDAYQEIVQDHGLSVGAVVEVDAYVNYNTREKKMGIVKSINWGTINVFSAMSTSSSFAASPLVIEVIVDGKVQKLSGLSDFFGCIGSNGEGYSWGGGNLLRVVTHSPTPLDPEWITSYKESFETLVKKRNLEQLKDGMTSDYRAPNLVKHINQWK